MSGNDNRSETTVTTAVSYTVQLNDYNILVIGATGAVAITLPAPTTVPAGRVFRIYKDAAAQTITITPASGLIDAGANITLASGAKHGAEVLATGTGYVTISAY